MSPDEIITILAEKDATIARLSLELKAARGNLAETIALNNQHYRELCSATIELDAAQKALEAVDSEILLQGHLKELVDDALSYAVLAKLAEGA